MRKRYGFTLLEILLAVVLFALAMAAVYGVFVSSLQSQKRYAGTLGRLEEAHALRRLLERDLRGLLLLDGQQTFKLARENVHGTALSRMDLLTSADPFLGLEHEDIQGDICEVGYRVLRDGSAMEPSYVLVRRQDGMARPPVSEGGDAMILARDIARFDVAFLAEDVGSSLLQGTPSERFLEGGGDAWDEAGKLPRAVWVGLAFSRGPSGENLVQDNGDEIEYDLELVVPILTAGEYPEENARRQTGKN